MAITEVRALRVVTVGVDALVSLLGALVNIATLDTITTISLNIRGIFEFIVSSQDNLQSGYTVCGPSNPVFREIDTLL